MPSPEWVCNVCLVKNEADSVICCCCSETREGLFESETGTGSSESASEVKLKQSTTLETPTKPDNDRECMKFDPNKLPTISVFICGSSEIEQIPEECCDRRKQKGKNFNELESLYECRYPTPILFKFKGKVSSVACGALHTAIVTDAGVVYTFGCNDMGALGRSHEEIDTLKLKDSQPYMVKLKYSIKKVTCGDNHTLFLTNSGTVYFCGGFKDTYGDIGVADYSNLEELKQLKFVSPPVVLPCNEPGSTVIQDICSGENHCVLLAKGGVGIYTFGSNEFGQLMIHDDNIQNYVEEDIDLGNEEIKKLSLTWPQFNSVEDLGLSVTLHGKRRRNLACIDRIFTGYCTTFLQIGHNKIYGAGRNAQGEVGCEDSKSLSIHLPVEVKKLQGIHIKQMGGGQFFSWALDNNGNLYTWGRIDYIGHGLLPENPIYKPTLLNSIITLEDEEVDFCFNGADTCFAVTDIGRVFAWGSGQNYILGNGVDETNVWIPKELPLERFTKYKIIGGKGGSQHTAFLCSKG
ncbi:bifunctional Regulator of chromosome condensation [Babesia duncani]|uniref:Bifunctional Regulator of chromosome condensation n=1 Tax=Babesia duncani TaxID=323732 RepID=A0AAD9UNF9_9APIC|nr:bifunctional Regulator of chromosome condensation [Babesia duncani]